MQRCCGCVILAVHDLNMCSQISLFYTIGLPSDCMRNETSHAHCTDGQEPLAWAATESSTNNPILLHFLLQLSVSNPAAASLLVVYVYVSE